MSQRQKDKGRRNGGERNDMIFRTMPEKDVVSLFLTLKIHGVSLLNKERNKEESVIPM